MPCIDQRNSQSPVHSDRLCATAGAKNTEAPVFRPEPLNALGHNDLFGGSQFRLRGLALGGGFSTFAPFFAGTAARLTTRASGGVATARLTFCGTVGSTFSRGGDRLGRHVLDHRLRTAAGNFRLLAFRLVTLRLFTARLPRLLLLTRLLGMLARLLALLLRLCDRCRLVEAVDVVTVAFAEVIAFVAIVPIITVVALEALLHLRLGGGNDAVIVFGVLQIVFRHDAVAGALGVPGKRRVFFGDVLGRTADLHVWAGAVIRPGQWVGTLAVEITATTTAAAAAVTPATTLVLLSWPHRYFT